MRNGLLWVSIVAGTILILMGSMAEVQPLGKDLAPNSEVTVAYIDGQPVPESLFVSVADNPDDRSDREQIDRFLGEQILIEKALVQGIISRDRTLRAAVLDVMREFVISEKQIAAPTNAILQDYYTKTLADYTPPARYQVRTHLISSEAVQDSLGDVSSSQAGSNQTASDEAVSSQTPSDHALGATEPYVFEGEANTRFLPLGILRRTIGDDAAMRLPMMQAGDQISVERADGILHVRLDGIRQGVTPAFDVVKRRVEEAWYQDQENQIFNAYLKHLLQTSNVTYVGE
jgi:hypothetical protein